MTTLSLVQWALITIWFCKCSSQISIYATWEPAINLGNGAPCGLFTCHCSMYQKWCTDGQIMNSRPQLFDVRGGGGGGIVHSDHRATVRQITSSYNRDDQGNVSTHSSLYCQVYEHWCEPSIPIHGGKVGSCYITTIPEHTGTGGLAVPDTPGNI